MRNPIHLPTSRTSVVLALLALLAGLVSSVVAVRLLNMPAAYWAGLVIATGLVLVLAGPGLSRRGGA